MGVVKRRKSSGRLAVMSNSCVLWRGGELECNTCGSRACSRRQSSERSSFRGCTDPFASKLAPSVPGMGRNQPLESSGQTK
ncbi:hypothetical protein CVE34_28375 [Pseudomonas syringae pv. actinidiae]|uniref:Thiamine biosynthesis lipoprotein ApbE n=2 Tax=Pseudomonas syringae group TaxID=136849 RepID=A0A2G7N6I1_PSESF|nr:hypothetical protein CT122_04910 [Pseudomonas syringae pv. actinidiae]AYL79373.1 hypothetical protein CN228_04980 [Pseudomonas syringae pv. actinidiae str. Shaanxi_M228]OZI87029.1 hypothetical protein CFN58_06815 [Pseudomonas avellanae]AYL14075.1 hypothetical protein D9N00_05470 [Pseudomonas syringae pv. actinidiae]NAS74892.1 hypothetical protein [Pseudomonas syringae pv. actinidiae]